MPHTAAKKAEFDTPRKLLLMPYAVVPLTMLIVLIDQLFLGGRFKSHFMVMPESLLLYSLFFNLPHVAASTVTFFDLEYLKHYSWRLYVPAFIIVITFILFPSITLTPVFALVVTLTTIIHVVGQQFGLSVMLGVPPRKIRYLWMWLAFTSNILFLYGYAAPPNIRPYMEIGAWIGMAAFLICSYFIYKATTTPLGKLYVTGIVISIVWAAALFLSYYLFLAILIPRVVHDITAFTFYISHDTNRNKGRVRNMIYETISFLKVPVYILCPLVAILLAFPISYFHFVKGQEWAYKIFIFLTFMHYYTETFIWKKGTPHREYIRMR